MKRLHTISRLIIPALLVVFCSQGLAEPVLVTMRGKFVEELKKLDEALDEGKLKADETYLMGLVRLESLYKKAGSQDGYSLVQAELKRFQTHPVPSRVIHSRTPPELKKLQQSFTKISQKLATDRALEIMQLTEKYIAALEKQKKKLAAQNKVDEAVAVQLEIIRLDKNESIVGALTLLERLAQKRPRTVVKSSTAPLLPTLAAPNQPVPGIEGKATLRYSDQIQDWWADNRPGGRKALSKKAPEKSWKQPKKEKLEKTRYFGQLAIGNDVGLNVIQQVGDNEDLHGWFSFGVDRDFTAKQKKTFRTPRTKDARVKERSQLLNFPVRYPDGEGHYHAIEVWMVEGHMQYSSACVMEGQVTLAGAVHPVAIYDGDSNGFYEKESLYVIIKNKFTDETLRVRAGQPFALNRQFYQLDQVSLSGQDVLFKPLRPGAGGYRLRD